MGYVIATHHTPSYLTADGVDYPHMCDAPKKSWHHNPGVYGCEQHVGKVVPLDEHEGESCGGDHRNLNNWVVVAHTNTCNKIRRATPSPVSFP